MSSGVLARKRAIESGLLIRRSLDLNSDMSLSRLQQRANRIFLAWVDLNEAREYLRAYPELTALCLDPKYCHIYSAREAVLVAAIVTYSRPFTESRSRGFADERLATKQLFKGQPELKALHEVILDRRRTAIAHADWKEHKTELLLQSVPGSSLRSAARPGYAKGVEVEEFAQLIDHCSKWCLSVSAALDQQIYSTESAHLRSAVRPRSN